MADVTVRKFVNGINVSDVAANTLFKNATNIQVITGKKTFENDVQMDNVSTDGLIDGLNVSKTAFVTLNTVQFITGHKRFTEDFISKYISVEGKSFTFPIVIAYFN